MDIQALKIFVQVVESGSFTEGARLLFMAQSNASTAVKNLERETGCALLIRSREGVMPTSEGVELLQLARRILMLSDEAGNIGRKGKEPAGVLRIASMESMAVVRLAPLLPAFSRLYPGIQLKLKTGDTLRQLEWLKKGEVDFAFPGEKPKEKLFESQPLFLEKMVFASIARKIKKGKNDEIRSYVVLPPGCSFRDRMESLLRSSGETRFFLHETSGIHTLYACVIAGMGSGFFPKSFLDYHAASNKNLSIRMLKGKDSHLTIYGAWRSDLQSSSVLNSWLSFLQKTIK